MLSKDLFLLFLLVWVLVICINEPIEVFLLRKVLALSTSQIYIAVIISDVLALTLLFVYPSPYPALLKVLSESYLLKTQAAFKSKKITNFDLLASVFGFNLIIYLIEAALFVIFLFLSEASDTHVFLN